MMMKMGALGMAQENYTIEVKKALKITRMDIISYVLDGVNGDLGFGYWAELCLDDADYQAAQTLLNESGQKINSSYRREEVLYEILRSGGKITVHDRKENINYDLTIEKLLNGWKKYIETTGYDDFDEYRTDDADGIMQYVIFGKWVYK